MKENKYDDNIFFQKYSQMSRSQQGLAGAGEWETLRKLLPDFKDKRVLDLGCGYGWHCIYAMEHGASSVVGVDISHKMLEVAKEKTHFPQVEYKCCAIEDVEFPEESFDVILSSLDKNSFDVIWSEGAIYNIGFEKGLSLWRNYLKDNGYIAVSEISWLIDTRPEEIQQYWVNAYPEIDTIDNKLSVIEKCGYTSVVHFALDDKCWKDNYYQPILEKSEEFLKKYNYADEVKEFVEAGKVEADLYNRFKDYYSYVFYIAKKK